jgi:hypothetical protein
LGGRATQEQVPRDFSPSQIGMRRGRNCEIDQMGVEFCQGAYQVLQNAKFTDSNLCDRSKIPSDVRRVLSDPDCRVADKVIGRYGQIVRSRHAVENAAGQIVF